jgi:lysophospholipase L1-like esterase
VDEAWFRWNAEAAIWPPDEDALNIFVFGGSSTFGYGVADNETIPNDIQKLLAEQFPERKIQVYNFGQGTYFSAQELRLFENLLLDGHIPDIAIFIDGINETTTQPYSWYEIDCALQENRENLLKPAFELPMMRAASAILRRFESNDDVANTDDNTVPMETVDSGQVFLNRWLSNREMLRGIAANFGIDVLFVWQAHPAYHYDTSYHIFWEAPLPDSSIYPAMAALENDWQNWDDFLYLADMQIGREELLYVDKVHYNAAFNAEIAKLIVAAIAETVK